ncbi:hypothetical protein N7G274_010473 [Stereocaulon virgatum]|uniref:Uncharacterized protein n=1 Tax=Stereocaulon virgatum TaxID=373712 RepID=A0ABR3ZTI9_9LECA
MSILRIYHYTGSIDAVYKGNATKRMSDSEPKSPLVTPDGEEPTDDEVQGLRHVSDRILLASWYVAAISLIERFTYYGINSPFHNYAQSRLDGPLRPGTLSLGQASAQASATDLNDAFQFIVYLSPIGWAIVADTWLSRYEAIYIATVSEVAVRAFITDCYGVYFTGTWVIFATPTSYALYHDTDLGCLLCGIIAAGLGLGGFKACVSPFMGLATPPNDMRHRPNLSSAEQYTKSTLRVKTMKNTSRSILDRSLSL